MLLFFLIQGSGFASFEDELSSCMRGESCFSGAAQQTDPSFRAFVSFSMPETVWIEISQGIERHGGGFVLRGLPGNSFQIFLGKVMALRKKGVYAPISIDPGAFSEYGVDAVPTFVLIQEEGFRKVVGNVTVDHALRKLQGGRW